MPVTLNDFLVDTQPNLETIKINADNNTYYGAGVDTLGYQGVVFFAAAYQGEVATYGLKAQQDTDAAFGTAADLAGSNVAFATGVTTDGFAFVDIKNPAERYVRPALVVPNLTTPNSVVIISVRYGKNWRPEVNADGELHVTPAEGTA